MFRTAARAGFVFAVAIAALTLSGCGGPTPDAGEPASDGAADITSYQLTGGDGKYQFSGVLCSVDGGEIPPAAAGVTGGANMAPSIGVFSWNWLYTDGDGEQIDSATGEVTDVTVTGDSITITATYKGYASIGDGGTNTKLAGEMVFEGQKTDTPASCLG